MAAHTYRTWLWHQVGFATWNAQWYGGHHMAGYSLLYPPLAALRGHAAGRRRRRASSAVGLFAHARPADGADARRRRARGVAVPRRRDEQRRDRADAVHARDRARGRRLGVRAALADRGRRVLSLASVWASPVAGVFLCVAAVAMLAGARLRDGPAAGRLAHRARARRAGGRRRAADGGCCSPRAARTTSSARRSGRCCSSASARSLLVDPSRRTAIWAAGDLRRDPRRRVRDPELARPERAAARRRARAGAARPVRAAARAARRDRRSSPSRCSTCSGCPRCARSRRRAGTRRRRPRSTQEVLDFLQDRARPGERLEVPLTRNHWEATYLAEDYPLARGWHRQLDRKVNPLFYDRDHPLTPDALPALAARERRPLGRAAERAARLLGHRGAQAAARRACRSSSRCTSRADWRIWEVRDPEPPVSGPARLTAAGADGFDLEATRPGRVIVRQHGTPVLDGRRGRRLRLRGPRDGLDARRRPPRRDAARAGARSRLAAALRRQPHCADTDGAPGGPLRDECGQPPCERSLTAG